MMKIEERKALFEYFDTHTVSDWLQDHPEALSISIQYWDDSTGERELRQKTIFRSAFYE